MGESSGCRNNVDFASDQLGCELGHPFEPILSRVLESDVLPFNPSNSRRASKKAAFSAGITPS
jgi:hypothetical protein